MTCWRKMSTRRILRDEPEAPAGARPKKTAPEGAVFSDCRTTLFLLLFFFGFFFFRFGGLAFSLFRFFFRGPCGCRRGGCGGAGREGRGLALLHDGDGLDLAALQLEDGHLGVLAVTLGVEFDGAGRAGELDVEDLGA